jgi:hexokinase
VFDITHRKWTISDELKKGPGAGLFAWIADRIEEFLSESCHHERPEGTFPLGMTFSFPCDQLDINVGKLINWTKGTCCCDQKNAIFVCFSLDVIRIFFLSSRWAPCFADLAH